MKSKKGFFSVYVLRISITHWRIHLSIETHFSTIVFDTQEISSVCPISVRIEYPKIKNEVLVLREFWFYKEAGFL